MIAFRSIRDAVKGNDFLLIFFAMLASFIGMVFIYSATRSMSGGIRYVLVQLGSFTVGIVAMYIISKLDYEDILELWKFVAAFCIGFLLLVLVIGIGRESTGTKGWIRLGFIGIQPAEIAKIGFIITLSKHLSVIKDEINYIKNIALLLLHLMVPVGLVLMQPDVGTALVFVFIFICMVFVAGIYRRYVIGALGAFGVFSVFAWFFLLNTIQKQRIFAFLEPESASSTYGYHVMQSKIAIGSGQTAGKGLFNGIQTQLGILPAKQTDFIFAVIGEEAGFIMCIVTVIVLFGLILRCISIGRNSRTPSGSYICIGVAAMWIFHVFENIGMTIGLMPVTGIPLPFVSYGGSSLLTNFLAIGLVLSVYSRKKTLKF